MQKILDTIAVVVMGVGSAYTVGALIGFGFSAYAASDYAQPVDEPPPSYRRERHIDPPPPDDVYIPSGPRTCYTTFWSGVAVTNCY